MVFRMSHIHGRDYHQYIRSVWKMLHRATDFGTKNLSLFGRNLHFGTHMPSPPGKFYILKRKLSISLSDFIIEL
jgi:hypothetical protein